jgi:hypothetical protein
MEAWRRVQNSDGEELSHLESWQHETSIRGGGGILYQGEVPMAVDICYFIDGVHYAGEYCPHGDEEYPPNWTA